MKITSNNIFPLDISLNSVPALRLLGPLIHHLRSDFIRQRLSETQNPELSVNDISDRQRLAKDKVSAEVVSEIVVEQGAPIIDKRRGLKIDELICSWI